MIGNETTLGSGAFVHYGVTVGDHVLVEADSFLMKGGETPDGTTWGGNPAMAIGESSFAVPRTLPDPALSAGER